MASSRADCGLAVMVLGPSSVPCCGVHHMFCSTWSKTAERVSGTDHLRPLSPSWGTTTVYIALCRLLACSSVLLAHTFIASHHCDITHKPGYYMCLSATCGLRKATLQKIMLLIWDIPVCMIHSSPHTQTTCDHACLDARRWQIPACVRQVPERVSSLHELHWLP